MTPPATAAKTVVVANPAEAVRVRFAAALQGAGHLSIGVGSEPELLACLRRRSDPIDLVVLDLRIGRPGGIDLVRSIRSIEVGRWPIVVFSGSITTAGEVRDLADLGVEGYVNEHSGTDRIVPSLAPHLFPDSFNRRTSPRVRLGIPVTCRVEGTITAAFMLNLGTGGIGVRTMTPPAAGTAVAVRFRLPGGEREISADARVAWSDRRLGMGLQFERVDVADQAAIDAFVDRHGNGGVDTLLDS